VANHLFKEVSYFRGPSWPSRTPFVLKLVIRIANYPERLDSSVKFVENSIQLTCLEITGYGIRYSTVLRFLELQIRRGRNV